jgi:lipoprotein NlpD
MFSKLLVLFSILSLSACATVEQPSSTTASIPAAPCIPTKGYAHVVQKGETLWRICKTYNADLEDVVRANRIPESSNIAVGQTIVIPRSNADTVSPQTNFASRGPSDFIWPAKGKIIGQFREKSSGVANKGIDIATDTAQDVLASQDGRVAFIGHLAGYGETLIISHSDEISTVYCGNSSVNVKTGDDVKQGMVIAKTGHSPRLDTGSIHFEIRRKNKPQNPLYYLN